MARTYKRDANGRFAGGGGGGTRSGRPAARPVSRGRNRLTRDNAGRIASVGGEGATARGGRLRTAGGKLRATQTAKIKGSGAGTIAKPKGLKPGALKSKGKSAQGANPPLTPSQVAGARRRASERPEVFFTRAEGRTRRRLQELQNQKSSLETALRRRRGKLDEAGKKAAANNLSRTNRQINRVKDAQSRYRQETNVAAMTRGMKMDYRTRNKAPQNERTTRNRLDTLRRRVSFLKKDEIKPTDYHGEAYDGPKLKAAKKALTDQATIGMRGLRVGIRSKPKAIAAQRKRTGALIKQANATKKSRGGTYRKTGLYTKPTRRSMSNQINLLTGGIDRIAGRFRQARTPR